MVRKLSSTLAHLMIDSSIYIYVLWLFKLIALYQIYCCQWLVLTLDSVDDVGCTSFLSKLSYFGQSSGILNDQNRSSGIKSWLDTAVGCVMSPCYPGAGMVNGEIPKKLFLQDWCIWVGNYNKTLQLRWGGRWSTIQQFVFLSKFKSMFVFKGKLPLCQKHVYYSIL